MKAITHEDMNDPYVSAIVFDEKHKFFGALHEGKIVSPHKSVEVHEEAKIFVYEQRNVGYSAYRAMLCQDLYHGDARFVYDVLLPDFHVVGIPYRCIEVGTSINAVAIRQWASVFNKHYGASMLDTYNKSMLYNLNVKVLEGTDSDFMIILGKK